MHARLLKGLHVAVLHQRSQPQSRSTVDLHTETWEYPFICRHPHSRRFCICYMDSSQQPQSIDNAATPCAYIMPSAADQPRIEALAAATVMQTDMQWNRSDYRLMMLVPTMQVRQVHCTSSTEQRCHSCSRLPRMDLPIQALQPSRPVWAAV